MASKVLLFGLIAQAVIVAVLSQNTGKDTAAWKASFDISDTDGDQKVSPEEFRETMQDMGWALTLEQQDAAFAEYDIDEAGDGFSFGEFKQMWFHTLAFSGGRSPNVPNDVQHAQIDRNGDGNIVLEELISGAYIGGIPWTDAQIEDYFNTFDKYPKDGKMNLCELMAGHNDVTFD